MSETAKAIFEMEKTYERTGQYLGRLKDFGFINPGGIPSEYADYSDDQLRDKAQELAERLVAPTDKLVTSCIDGRKVLQNADGSVPEIRYRRVGGSASDLAVAMNSESSVLQVIDQDDTIGHQIESLAEITGQLSAHLGSCGGANGEVEDDRAIASNPNIMNATGALISIPAVSEDLGIEFKQPVGDRIRETASQTADILEQKGWDGQTYVDGVCAKRPDAVEDLEVDLEHPFKGHKEPCLAIILGDETLPLEYDGFAWNLEASKNAAKALASQAGQAGYERALTADIAKHMAVASRLPSDETPVFLLRSKAI